MKTLYAIILVVSMALPAMAQRTPKTVTADTATGALLWPGNFWDVERDNIYSSLGLWAGATNQTAAAWRAALGLSETTTNITAAGWRAAIEVGEISTNTTAAGYRSAIGANESITNTTPAGFRLAYEISEIATNTTASGWRSALAVPANSGGFMTNATISGSSTFSGGILTGSSYTIATNAGLTFVDGSASPLVAIVDGRIAFSDNWPVIADATDNYSPRYSVAVSNTAPSAGAILNRGTADYRYGIPTTYSKTGLVQAASATVARNALGLGEWTTNSSSPTGSVSFPITLAQGGTGGTNAAQARGALGFDVGSPGELGTNMLASSTAAGARSLIGLSAGPPGSIPTNFLTTSDEYSAWDALKQSQTRLLSVPGVPQSAIPQDCVVYNAPVDVPASFTGGAGATLSQGIETNGSSKISQIYTAGGTWANLKVVGDGVQATPTVSHYPATTQDWSGCHFIVKAYIEGSTNGWSDAYSSLTVTLYDDAGYYCTGTLNAFAPETATTTNGFYYTGSIQIPAVGDYLSANWSFQSTTSFDPRRIKRFVLNIGMSDATKVVPIHIGAITVAKSPNKKGIVCIVFDQTKEYGLPYAAALKNFGFTATWAFNTNSSYQYWSDWELIRNYDQGHGYTLYGNDTVTTTNHWEIITRNSGGPRYLTALGIDPSAIASMVVFGGTGSPAYNVKQDEVGRLLLRKYGMQFYNASTATKVIYPADLPSTIVRIQSLSKSNYAPTATSTNAIVSGTIYYVFSGPTNGTTAVTYNGTNYQLGQSFKGASGVTNYIVTGTGAVCTRTGWQAAYEAAVKSGGMVAALIHAHTEYAELPDLITLMGGLWARDAMLGRLEVIPISKVFDRQRQGWPRRPVNAVAKTGGTNSYEIAIDAIITELQRGGLMRE